MKPITFDELKLVFDNRNKEGEKGMNIKPKDNFVLFFADG